MRFLVTLLHAKHEMITFIFLVEFPTLSFWGFLRELIIAFPGLLIAASTNELVTQMSVNSWSCVYDIEKASQTARPFSELSSLLDWILSGLVISIHKWEGSIYPLLSMKKNPGKRGCSGLELGIWNEDMCCNLPLKAVRFVRCASHFLPAWNTDGITKRI